jgi:hypothetical protein
VPRVSPIRSVLEWLGAAALLLAAVWLASARLRDWIQPRPGTLAEVAAGGSSGIPYGATEVPLLLLLDGTEIKVGDPHARLVSLLKDEHAIGPSETTTGEFGERWTRGYQHGLTTFYVVCERTDAKETLKVARIYLP